MLNLAASLIGVIFNNKGSKICGEDRISALPDDLLIRILWNLPTTKDAVATMLLSKRWRFVWTMVPDLVYIDNTDDDDETVVPGLLDRLFGTKSDDRIIKPECIWRFLEESLRLHKAQKLEYVNIQLAQHCPIDVDVGKVIANVINRKVHEFKFTLSWSSKPITLPKCLYTCDSLAYLNLTDKILVDVPNSLGDCFPSLLGLGLHYVMYKDDESVVKLLSSCPILKDLAVDRHQEDNVTDFVIKVPSLEYLLYEYVDNAYPYGTLVIDSSALKKIFITDYSGNSCSIDHEDNKPCFDKAKINIHSDLDNKFIRSFVSLRCLELFINFATVGFCNDIHFSKLLECKITLIADELDWLEPFMRLLQNSPNLKTVFIDQSMIIGHEEEEFTLPSSVPECLSNHLEIFEWEGYEGRSKEIEMVRYIFGNSKCLKRAGISMKLSSTRRRNHREDPRKYKMMKELKSMPRVSTTSQLLFFTQLEFMNIPDEILSD